jgi:hypothetical protein
MMTPEERAAKIVLFREGSGICLQEQIIADIAAAIREAAEDAAQAERERYADVFRQLREAFGE